MLVNKNIVLVLCDSLLISYDYGGTDLNVLKGLFCELKIQEDIYILIKYSLYPDS